MTRTNSGAFNLERFADAQAGVLERALTELRSGRKRTHWMWFVFPQLAALGRSETARFYGLSGLEEARAYLAHPVLGPRLADAVNATLTLPSNADVQAVFGSPDDLKFRSCLTLFAAAGGEPAVFRSALERWFDGRPDPLTQQLLGGAEDQNA